jgi:hypothetical protein
MEQTSDGPPLPKKTATLFYEKSVIAFLLDLLTANH